MNRLNVTALLVLLTVICAGSSAAKDPTPFTARSGLDIAQDAARTWASDARLIYLENDEMVAPSGRAARWGYLFYSERKGKARGYTVRDGKILEASDPGFDFEAPPLADQWIDSGDALLIAEKNAGAKYRRENSGRLATMFLIRGAFHEKEPDATTWALVYKADSSPSLVIIVDAAKGKVVRTWRG